MADAQRGDRLWLAGCTSAGVAVDITLNKYSNALPGMAVVAIWAIPAIIFICWFVRVERTKNWLRSRFFEHPVSYILMFLVLIPFGWQATATMVSKLQTKPETQATTIKPHQQISTAVPEHSEMPITPVKSLDQSRLSKPKAQEIAASNPCPSGITNTVENNTSMYNGKNGVEVEMPCTKVSGNFASKNKETGIVVQSPPTYQQNCVGSACAQGPGSQATYNQFGAPKLRMTQAQLDAVSDAMKPYAGITISIFCHDATPDSAEYAKNLAKAFVNAGIFVEGPNFGIAFAPGGVVASGLTVSFSQDRLAAAEALARVLIAQGLTTPPLNGGVDSSMKPGKFSITIAPNR